MISHSIQIRDPRPLFSNSRVRSSLRRTGAGKLKRMTIPRIDHAQIEGQEIVEPALSIEDAIRRYVEAQPAQLYHGGL